MDAPSTSQGKESLKEATELVTTDHNKGPTNESFENGDTSTSSTAHDLNKLASVASMAEEKELPNEEEGSTSMEVEINDSSALSAENTDPSKTTEMGTTSVLDEENDVEATDEGKDSSEGTEGDSPTEPVKKKTRKKWKKPVGKPNRPLSAYNLYFKKERGVMLGDAADIGEPEPGKKRVHRKTHGKIGFAEMARMIGQKWKKLSDEEKKPFEETAKKEKERYAVLLAEWREEQKKKSIADSLGNKGKGSKESDDDIDPLVKSINEDREELLKRHSAFRMQMKMYEEMAISRLARDGRALPALDYMRNMPDDRGNPFLGGRMAQYPNAAEDSGRNILQHMLSLSGHEGPGPMSRMMHGSRLDGQIGSSMGNNMGTVGVPMGGSMVNSMGNSMGHSSMGNQMGGPNGNPMGHPMGNPMNNHMGPMGSNTNSPMRNGMGGNMSNHNSTGNEMNNPMGNGGVGGMVPVSNGGPQMHGSHYPSQYDIDHYPQMRMPGHMTGMNNSRLSPGPESQPRHSGPPGHMNMMHHEGPVHNHGHGHVHMEAPMMRRYHHPDRYGHM